MTCRDFENDFELFVQGDLDEARSSAIGEHVKSCAACEKRRAEAERLVAELNEAMNGCEPPVGFADRQARKTESRLEGRKSRAKTTALAACAAGLLIMLGASYFIGKVKLFKGHQPVSAALDAVSVVSSPGAKFAVLSPRRLRLDSGTLSCTVQPASEPFSVETPAGVATALGTQFYISVQPVEETPMNAKRLAATVFVAAGIVQFVNPFGSVAAHRGEQVYAEDGAAPSRNVADLAAAFTDRWTPVPSKQVPSIKGYTLPLDPAAVLNAGIFESALGLNPNDPRLRANGFVILRQLGADEPGSTKTDNVVDAYKGLADNGLPIFVTSDSLLHLLHIQFDEALRDVEEAELAGDVTAMAEMLERGLAKETSVASPAAREGCRKAWVFASVGLKTLKPGFAPAEEVRADVELVTSKMKAHAGFWPEPENAEEEWPLFRYSEDFSQYVPRGHYTQSEVLKRYFLAMMWFGRMTFLLNGGDPHSYQSVHPYLVSEREAAAQTIGAAAMTRLLATGTVADGRKASDLWKRIYSVTAFFVGLADDLGMQQYAAALGPVMNSAEALSELARPERLDALRAELAKSRLPAIYSGTGGQATSNGLGNPEDLHKALVKSEGFRLMGQRFVPDSYILGRLVFPVVGPPRNGRCDMFTCVVTDDGPIRGFPRGLDVMSVLGSARARSILTTLGDDAYGTNETGENLKHEVPVEALRAEFSRLTPRDWNRNLYWSWLYGLQALLRPYGEGYPTFMTTTAWHDKALTTALASWAQLRHDTILYAKQSYTLTLEEEPEPPAPGFVEPDAEFLGRLLSTVRMMQATLSDLKVLDRYSTERLRRLEALLLRLHSIAEQELAGKTLAEEDALFVNNFGDAVKELDVRRRELETAWEQAAIQNDTKTANELRAKLDALPYQGTQIIADVHTDQNSKEVLEEGTGPLEIAVVCVRQADGTLTLAAGPVLTYFEFRHPMDDRLTDKAWRDLLASDHPPAQPAWTTSFRSK
ncbi:MAG: hypothetical protein FD180_2720 [Planctomycetota bacterium]|nr:MAG: hypothetical protein FD180_2720 [Planctomycetota bacterium]